MIWRDYAQDQNNRSIKKLSLYSGIDTLQALIHFGLFHIFLFWCPKINSTFSQSPMQVFA